MYTLYSFMIGIAFVAAASAQNVFAEAARTAESNSIDRGRYIVKIAGCNDCHTSGYAQTGGQVPEKQWLTGDQIGWRGPWGTTYPGNLRLFMQNLSEDQCGQDSKDRTVPTADALVRSTRYDRARSWRDLQIH